MVVHNPKSLRKAKISTELMRVLETRCSRCDERYDLKECIPKVIHTCQHHFCHKCIQKIFKDEQSTCCPKCEHLRDRTDVRDDPFRTGILTISSQKQYMWVGEMSKEEVEGKERMLAEEFRREYGKKLNCPECREMFDDDEHAPIILCPNDHLRCSKCVRQLEVDYECPVEGCLERIKTVAALYKHKLLMNLCTFISKMLFKRKVFFTYGDKKVNFRVSESVTIKDLFHFLQGQGILSPHLEIAECCFYVARGQQEQEVSYVNTLGDLIANYALEVVEVVMKCKEAALKKGVKVTQPSKVLEELPIKICNFEDSEQIDLPHPKKEPIHSSFRNHSALRLQKSGLNFSAMRIEGLHDYEDMPLEEEEIAYKVEQPSFIRRENAVEEEDRGECEAEDEMDEIPIHQSIIRSNIRSNMTFLEEEEEPVYVPKLQPLSPQKRDLIKRSKLGQKSKVGQRYKKSSIKLSRLDSMLPERKHMEVGSEIDPRIVEKLCTKVPKKQRQAILDNFLNKHEISEEDEPYVCFKTFQMVTSPFSPAQVEESQVIEKDRVKRAQQSDTLSLLLVILKQSLEDGQIMVNFSKESSEKTRLSLKVITSHYLSERILITETIEEDETWFFEKLHESYEQLSEFIQEHKSSMAIRFNLHEESLVLHKIEKGYQKIKLVLSTNEGSSFAAHMKSNLARDIEIKPFFKYLFLSAEDFSVKGKIAFPKKKNSVEFRGNWPYYQPITAIRYGMKVSGMFDGGNDRWLEMANKPGEWAVGFHGVRNPNNNYKRFKNITEGILGTLKNKNIMLEGESDSFADELCLNKLGERMMEGVRLTPDFGRALHESEEIVVGEKAYYLVFQCRLKPEEIRVRQVQNSDWVMRCSEEIRPYGIVIITKQHRDEYPSLEQQFGEEFTYGKYKDRIEGKAEE